jgi:hypothetical protein
MSHYRLLLLIAKQVGPLSKKNNNDDDDDQTGGHLIPINIKEEKRKRD